MYGTSDFVHCEAELSCAPVSQFENCVGVGGVMVLVSIMTTQSLLLLPIKRQGTLCHNTLTIWWWRTLQSGSVIKASPRRKPTSLCNIRSRIYTHLMEEAAGIGSHSIAASDCCLQLNVSLALIKQLAINRGVDYEARLMG